MRHHPPSFETLMRYARALGFGDVHIKLDSDCGLHAIIAVHNTTRGAAIGGCRLYQYKSFEWAMKDALRLSYMMTLKAAACDLPHGGAKAVILHNAAVTRNRDNVFRSFGDFVHQLQGRYITAMDLGTTTNDMNVIAERTPYVIGASDTPDQDPSPYTSRGIFRGIQAAVAFKLKKSKLNGLTVALQGAGKSAYFLAKLLYAQGVHLLVCDPNPAATEKFKKEFGATIITPFDSIYDVACDIFAPCAVGGTLNLQTLHKIRAKIIAGSANNQLAHRQYDYLIQKRDILYVPDFILNSGGLIYAAGIYNGEKLQDIHQSIENIYDRLWAVFERAQTTQQTTTAVADQIAKEKLQVIVPTVKTLDEFELCEL